MTIRSQALAALLLLLTAPALVPAQSPDRRAANHLAGAASPDAPRHGRRPTSAITATLPSRCQSAKASRSVMPMRI